MVGKLTRKGFKLSFLAAVLLLCVIALAACGGESTPTAVRATVAPTAIPSPAPALAYLAWTDFKYADEAEKAEQTLVSSHPDFPAWASWTESNRLYTLVKDANPERLKARAG